MFDEILLLQFIITTYLIHYKCIKLLRQVVRFKNTLGHFVQNLLGTNV